MDSAVHSGIVDRS